MFTEAEKERILLRDPFEGDFGQQDDRVFLDRMSVARKAGQCSFCKQEIAAGDEQRRLSAKFDGEMRSYRWCRSCCRSWIDTEDDDED